MEDTSKIQAHRESERRAMLARKYVTSVLREIANGNPSLSKFMAKLFEQVQHTSKEKIDEFTSKADECANLIGRNVKNKNALEKRLESIGISLGFPLEYSLALGQFHTPKGNRSSFQLYQEFNGCRLSREMLTDEGIEELRNEYSMLRGRSKTQASETTEIETQLKIDERKLKHSILARTKMELKSQIDNEKDRLDLLLSQKREEQKVGETLEVIEHLTPVQRQEIMRYLEASDALTATAKLIYSYKKMMGDIRTSKSNDIIIPEAFMKMVEEDGLSRDDVIGIFSIFNRIEKKHNQRGVVKQPIYKKGSNIADYKDVVEGFLRFVYEPEKPVENQEFLRRFDTPLVEAPKRKPQDEPEGEVIE